MLSSAIEHSGSLGTDASRPVFYKEPKLEELNESQSSCSLENQNSRRKAYNILSSLIKH